MLLFAASPARAVTPAPPSLIPYTTTIFAGGGPTATYAKGSLCPVSGLTEVDAYGDGCLATELVLNSPRYVTQDANGNYFFSDENATLIRRIDGATGIVTLVAGGGAKSTVGTACVSGAQPTTTEGDGCLGTEAYLGKTAGLVFSPLTGNLYFSDEYSYSIHMITATSNCTGGTPSICFIVPSSTTGNSTGTMTLIAGTPTGDGYFAGDATCNPATNTTCVVNQIAETGTTSTSSYLYKPVGLAFDAAGDLYLLDDYNEAVFALNTSSAPTTVAGITIPAGDITKIVGAGLSTAACIDGVYPAANGCTYPQAGSQTPSPVTATLGSGLHANDINIDGPLDVALDSTGNIYFDEFYWYNVGKVNATTDIYTPDAGVRGTVGTSVSARAAATSVAISSPAGLAFDSNNNGNNLYISDGGNGIIWRVDSATQSMYAIAGGSTTTYVANSTACPIGPSGKTATDTYGDGCPGLAAKFTNNGGARFSTAQATTTPTTLTGIFIDSYGNLLAADTGNKVIRKVAAGTAFGNVTGTPTQYVDVHFGATDGPAASQLLAYVITTGATNFAVSGTVTCGTANSDTTTDCIVPIKLLATTPGPVTGTLTVTSAAGKVSNFPLSATVVVPVASTTSVTVAGTCPPGGTSTLTAIVNNSVGLPSGGTVVIYVNGVAISTQTLPVSRKVTATYAFPVGTSYPVYATYSGDANDLASTTATQTVTTFVSAPFVLSGGTTAQPAKYSIVAGETALYTVNVSAYVTGQYQFYCSGLPSGASCIFYPPPPVTPTPGTTVCYGSATVALSVTTTQPKPVIYGFGAYSRNKWTVLGILPALLLALLVMVRRRKSPLKYSGVLLALAFLLAMASTMGCGSDFGSPQPGTPSGTYYFTVTGVDAVGDTQSVTPPTSPAPTPATYYYTLVVN